TGLPATPLLDVRDLLLKYQADGKPCAQSQCSELLRLNVTTAPVPLASQNRLTVLAGDNAGWPNGRRPIDHVTDLPVPVLGGTNYLSVGANVNGNDKPLPATFPFIASPWDGRNRVHQNP